MWQALVTICLIQNLSDCLILEDQKFKSHHSQRACESRAIEMASQVHVYMPRYKPMKYKCNKLRSGTLTK